ncbi:MAG: hypothetical protein A3F17_02125 [Gammaproteobacteria bacterium RIFCSPHIGHO2_12_FULL_41_15]|nr:MAG: hypothetical protein A3F17_02125 [Gammaproteobacteria bacterium RIFCSPHIGHO2_12_FULL_41_15]
MRMQKGFTLIEMMLVIAIAAVLASVGIMAYRHQSAQTRANKISLEMEHVLEAAMAYYDVNHAWPEKGDSGFEQNYLPNGINLSSIGEKFEYGSLGDKKTRFYAALELPNELAARVRAQLANATYVKTPDDPSESNACSQEESNCYVHAEVPVPGLAAKANNTIAIAQTGYLKGDHDNGFTKTVDFTCPSDQIGQLILMPVSVYAGNGVHSESSNYALQQFYAGLDHDCEKQGDQWHCAITLGGSSFALKSSPDFTIVKNSRVYAQYLALCEPAN